MKTKLKKGLSLVLALVMCLSLVQVAAFADPSPEPPTESYDYDVRATTTTELNVNTPISTPVEPVEPTGTIPSHTRWELTGTTWEGVGDPTCAYPDGIIWSDSDDWDEITKDEYDANSADTVHYKTRDYYTYDWHGTTYPYDGPHYSYEGKEYGYGGLELTPATAYYKLKSTIHTHDENCYSSVTYTFSWTLVAVYTVTFDANGGTVASSTQSIDDGKTATSQTPTRSGCTFMGWWHDGADGAKEMYDFSNTPVTSDITLTAKWNRGTVGHIDIGTDITAEVYIDGTLYTGNLTLAWNDSVNITAAYGDGTPVTFNRSSRYEYGGERQIREPGQFPTGTIDDPIYYTITLTKNVWVSGEENNIYVAVPVTLTTTIDYWSDNNTCPGIWDSPQNVIDAWRAGEVVNRYYSGIDVDFNTGSATTGSIQIQKTVSGISVDENTAYSFDFDIYSGAGKYATEKVTVPAGKTTASTIVTDVPFGSYCVVETTPATIDGYTLSGTTYSVGGNTATATQSDDIVLSSTNHSVSVNVTNAYALPAADTTVTVTKRWNNGDNATPPTSLAVQLLKGGTSYGDPVNLSYNTDLDYSWTHTWTVPNDGSKYTVTETVPGNYEQVDMEATAKPLVLNSCEVVNRCNKLEFTDWNGAFVVMKKGNVVNVWTYSELSDENKTAFIDAFNATAGSNPLAITASTDFVSGTSVSIDGMTIDANAKTITYGAHSDWSKFAYGAYDDAGQTIALTNTYTPKYGYTIEYYYDGTIDDTKTDATGSDVEDATVSSYTDKATTGYMLDSVDWGTTEEDTANAMTITTNAADNVIKVYYVKNIQGDDYGDASFRIYKTDGTNALGGVTFTLTDSSDIQVWSGATSSADDATKGYADVTIPKANLGTDSSYAFTLTETTPAHYNGAGPWDVTITKGAVTVVGPESDNFFHNAWSWLVSAVTGDSDNLLSNNVLTVVNTAKPTYHVTYSWSGLPNGAASVRPTDDNSYYAGDAVNVDSMFTSTSTEKIGHATYTFSGWTPSPALTGGKMPASDVTISGTWSHTSDDPTYNYTVTYYDGYTDNVGKNDGENRTGTYDSTHTINVDYNVDPADHINITRDNYAFSGWATSKGGTVAYIAGDKINFTASGHYDLYAVWTENSKYTYSLIYNGNGGALENGDPSYGDAEGFSNVYDTSKTYTIDENTFTRTGYSFMGWASDADANYADPTFAPAESLTLTSANSSKTLYAVWRRDDGGLNVTKTFAGLSEAQIAALDDNFTITVTGPSDFNEGEPLNMSLGDAESGNGSTDNPFIWGLLEIPTGQYSVTESNAGVTGYNLSTTNNGPKTVTAYPYNDTNVIYTPAQIDVTNTYSVIYNPPANDDTYYYRIDYVYNGYNSTGASIYSGSTTGSVMSTASPAYSFSAASTASRDGYDFDLVGDAGRSASLAGTSSSNPHVFTVEYQFTQIGEGDTPLSPTPTPTPETPVEIPEEETPLAEAPKTGDNINLWLLLALASGAGIVALNLGGRKRKEEDDK